jgi:hypothetical protein
MGIEDDIDIYIQGYRRFREITESPANKNTGYRYKKYLGLPVTYISSAYLRNLSDEERAPTIARAKQLLGPHGYTIYMAWRAQCLK